MRETFTCPKGFLHGMHKLENTVIKKAKSQRQSGRKNYVFRQSFPDESRNTENWTKKTEISTMNIFKKKFDSALQNVCPHIKLQCESIT